MSLEMTPAHAPEIEHHHRTVCVWLDVTPCSAYYAP